MIDNDSGHSEDMLYYDTWENITEVGRDNKEYNRVVKNRKECTVVELVDLFFDLLPDNKIHKGKETHQFKAMTALKENLAAEDLVIHCDFSENYARKYFREIPSCHFGGNRKQIMLHTVKVYIGAGGSSSIVTLSPDLRHDAVAVWSHLRPILMEFTNMKKVHIISDLTSSQYRNKSMCQIMIKKIIPLFPNLESFSWHYLESGYGKGAPDGLRGALKRTCDRVVARNIQDVRTLKNFTTVFEKM